MSAPVPDDVVPNITLTEVEISTYFPGAGDVTGITLKFLDRLPLRVGERVEVELVEIRRTVAER